MFPGLKFEVVWETPVKVSQAPHIFFAALVWNVTGLFCMALVYLLVQIPCLILWLLSCPSAVVHGLQKIPVRSSLVQVYAWVSDLDILSKGAFLRSSMCDMVRTAMKLALLMGKRVSAWIHQVQVK